MPVLVIGASGFVGSALLDVFGAEAVGTYCERPRPGLRQLDMRDARAVAKLVSEIAPSWILIPAAQPHVDWCEEHESESRDVNVHGPAAVAGVAREMGARVLFFSTDYVFDGREGPYDESAKPAPINVYGKHKLEAEERLLDSNPRNLVVRICGVYGYERPPKNFVMTLIERLRAGEQVRVPSDQWGTPTYVRDIARAAKTLVERDAAGVWHVAGPDFLPRYDFARRVCAEFGLNEAQVYSVPSSRLGQRAKRPAYAGLRAHRAEAVGVSCRNVADGLKALAGEMAQEIAQRGTTVEKP